MAGAARDTADPLALHPPPMRCPPLVRLEPPYPSRSGPTPAPAGCRPSKMTERPHALTYQTRPQLYTVCMRFPFRYLRLNRSRQQPFLLLE